MPKLVVISHIFNEQYLLPFWLEYHSSIFTHGIIIDYCSTDESVALVKKWCPTWTVVRTRNVNPDGSPNFEAHLIDHEVMEYETTVETGCLKICLNTTEFLVVNQDPAQLKLGCYNVPVYNVSSGKHGEFYPQNGPEFFANIRYIGLMPEYRKYRYMHSAPYLHYIEGRHKHVTPGLTCHEGKNDVFILYVKEYCVNDAMIRRRMQIQNNIPQSDKMANIGTQHLVNGPEILEEYDATLAGMSLINDRSIIEKICNRMVSHKQILKPHYRAIMLVLASHNNQVYKNGRQVWRQYMRRNPSIRVFFVYERLASMLDDYDETSDLVYPDIPEPQPGYDVTIAKTIKAMQYIHTHFTYDFCVRTNISTFWDFDRLLQRLNTLPTMRCYTGHGPLIPTVGISEHGYYVSGTDIIITPDLVELLLNRLQHVDYHLVDDAALGKFYCGAANVPIIVSNHSVCLFEDILPHTPDDVIRDRIEKAMSAGVDHYRVKSAHAGREEIDMRIYAELLKTVYNNIIMTTHYIQLFGRGDRLGANIVTFISQILFAFHNHLYIKYDRTFIPHGDNVRFVPYNQAYSKSVFIASLFDFIDEYNKTLILVEPLTEQHIFTIHFFDMISGVLHNIKTDYISFFKQHIFTAIKPIFEQKSLDMNYTAPFNPKKTIAVHLRLDDVKNYPDYDGRICANHFAQQINNGLVATNATHDAIKCEYPSCNTQAPISVHKIQAQIDSALLKHPGYEVIIITNPGENVSCLPYKCYQHTDEAFDLYLLCKCDVVILSRSTFALSCLFFGDATDVYIPLWGHVPCFGLYTKYDKCQTFNYFY